jgi:MFS family permease
MTIPADVRKAVVDAYYPRALGVADVARSRAQAGYGIASAIAAALVAAGVFGHLSEEPGWIRILGLAALVAWLVAAGLYLVAVSRPFEPATADQQSAEEFVEAALGAAATERDRIDRWQKSASLLSGLAAALTVAALGSALAQMTSPPKSARIALTSKGLAAARLVCGKHDLPQVVEGSVRPADLQDEIVALELPAGACRSGQVSLELPRSAVRAVAVSH